MPLKVFRDDVFEGGGLQKLKFFFGRKRIEAGELNTEIVFLSGDDAKPKQSGRSNKTSQNISLALHCQRIQVYLS